jgi:NAD(P)H-hydrate epimerase
MVSPWMEPNLAVAGSGDVLSGLLGRLVPQMETRLTAACAGVYIHGLAGSLLANEFPARGNLASEIADILPRAMQGE